MTGFWIYKILETSYKLMHLQKTTTYITHPLTHTHTHTHTHTVTPASKAVPRSPELEIKAGKRLY